MEYDCGRTGTEMGKVRKLVVIYTHPIASVTPQLHHTHHLPTLTTWTWPDLESKDHQKDGLGPNHHHLEYDCGRTGTKTGKVGKLVVINTHASVLLTLQVKFNVFIKYNLERKNRVNWCLKERDRHHNLCRQSPL